MYFGKDILMISITRPFWLELNVPLGIVKQEYMKYLLYEKEFINSTDDAIKYLKSIIENLQKDLISWEKSNNARNVIIDLYTILDKCFRFYINQKKTRTMFVENNINPSVTTYEINRNMSLNTISAINLWLENSLIFQNLKTEYVKPKDPPIIDNKLFVDLYIYGLVSRSLTLLSLNKREKTRLFYEGVIINLIDNNVEPIELKKYIPETYFITQVTGNQRVFKLTKNEYKKADSSAFGIGFKNASDISFLLSLRLFETIKKYDLKNGERSLVAFKKNIFISLINRYSKGKVDGNAFFNAFVMNRERINKNKSDSDVCIWKLGVNKYRHEIRPFICLEDNTVFTSYCALVQARELWLTFFENGGMVYTDNDDELTEGLSKRNIELSKQLVQIIIEKLEMHCGKGILKTEVDYKRIFGQQKNDYGDYDIIYYAKEIKELFVIEAKFFSDSYNASSMVTDYQKLFKKNGYYDHCRKRCDLVLKHPQKIKEFIGVEGEIKVHFLFISSKPLQIDFTDKDGIVSFPCVSIFDKYLEGKLLSEDGKRIVRPTKTI